MLLLSFVVSDFCCSLWLRWSVSHRVYGCLPLYFAELSSSILEYSMLSVWCAISLHLPTPLSLSCLVPADNLLDFFFPLLYLPAIEVAASLVIFAVASPLESISFGGIDASTANPLLDFNLEFSPMMLQLTGIYLFRLNNHFCSLKPGVNPGFPSYQVMVTTYVEGWRIKEDVRPIHYDVVNLILWSMSTICLVTSWKRCS